MFSRSLTIMVLLLVLQAGAQTTYHQESCSLVLYGTSNLHDWSCRSNRSKISLSMLVERGKVVSIQSLTAEFPVNSIKSSEGAGMDHNLYIATKSQKYPEISFRLEKVQSILPKGDASEITATGFLSVAGVTKRVSLMVRSRVYRDGSVGFYCNTRINMTDYRISPPVALFGLLRTGNWVDVSFSMITRPDI